MNFSKTQIYTYITTYHLSVTSYHKLNIGNNQSFPKQELQLHERGGTPPLQPRVLGIIGGHHLVFHHITSQCWGAGVHSQ